MRMDKRDLAEAVIDCESVMVWKSGSMREWKINCVKEWTGNRIQCIRSWVAWGVGVGRFLCVSSSKEWIPNFGAKKSPIFIRIRLYSRIQFDCNTFPLVSLNSLNSSTWWLIPNWIWVGGVPWYTGERGHMIKKTLTQNMFLSNFSPRVARGRGAGDLTFPGKMQVVLRMISCWASKVIDPKKEDTFSCYSMLILDSAKLLNLGPGIVFP